MTHLTFAELADSFEAQARSKRQWLETFSTGKKAWPASDIERKHREAEALEEGAHWFRRAAERDERKTG